MSNFKGYLKDKSGNELVVNDIGTWETVYSGSAGWVQVKIIGNICYTRGSLTGAEIESIYIPLGFTMPYQYVTLFAGSGNSYVKAYINSGNSDMGFSSPTGNANTTYVITTSFIMG